MSSRSPQSAIIPPTSRHGCSHIHRRVRGMGADGYDNAQALHVLREDANGFPALSKQHPGRGSRSLPTLLEEKVERHSSRLLRSGVSRKHKRIPRQAQGQKSSIQMPSGPGEQIHNQREHCCFPGAEIWEVEAVLMCSMRSPENPRTPRRLWQTAGSDLALSGTSWRASSTSEQTSSVGAVAAALAIRNKTSQRRIGALEKGKP